MTKKLKSRALLSSYQSSYDEVALVSDVLQEGNLDLTFHLQFFKKKLSSKKPEQETKFDNMFFQTVQPDEAQQQLLTPQGEYQPSKVKESPSWVKKIYRQIVIITHPDKISSITIDVIKNKLNKQYLTATEAMREAAYEKIIMIAHQLDIEVSSQIVEDVLPPKIHELRKEIISSQEQMGYRWYYISEKDKKKVLKKYLQDHGFVFTDEMINEAMTHGKNRIKRKVGKKPVKMRRARLK